MTGTDPRTAERARYARNAMLAEGKMLAGEVGAKVAVGAMVYAAVSVAADAGVCLHCVRKLLIGILDDLNDLRDDAGRDGG